MSLEERVSRLERVVSKLLEDAPTHQDEDGGHICCYCYRRDYHHRCNYEEARDIMRESSDI